MIAKLQYWYFRISKSCSIQNFLSWAKAFIHKPAQMIIQHELLESGLDMTGILDPAMPLRIGNNPFEASAFSVFGVGDELMTYQVIFGDLY